MYGAPMRLANKSLVWYPKKAWDAGRLRGSEDPRGAHRAGRPDQAERHHAVVHGLERRPGDRLGRHRLDRADDAHASTGPTSTTSGPRTRSPSTTRRSSRPSTSSARSRRPRAGLRRRADGGQHPGRRVDGPGVPQPARVHARAAGLLRDLVPPGRDPGRPRQRGRGLPVPGDGGGRRGSADPRWRGPRRALQRQRRRGDRGHAVPDLRRVRSRVGAGRRVALAAQDLRRRPTTRTRRPRTSPRQRAVHRRSSSTAPT